MHKTHENLPSVEQLEAFEAVAIELRFQNAADSLGISQPALSRRIQALEATVGVQLFDRSGRDVLLTDAGKMFGEGVTSWRFMLEDAQRRARTSNSGNNGRLAVGLVASAAISLVPQLVRECRKVHPDIQVSIHEMHESEQWDALDAGTLDLICVRIADRPGYESLVIRESDPVCFATYVDHPLANKRRVAVKDIVDEDFVLWPRDLDRQTAAREAAMIAEHGGDGMRIVYETPSVWAVLGLVASGLGSSLLAGAYSEIDWPGVVFVPVKGYSLPYALHWRPDSTNPAIQTFLAFAE